ncbi:peptide-methionine (S)-S-oxide reductase MsrA [Nitrosomonadales bacterium]|nr:peptide-methionine (S)-S-oxide reductase MsrA [Nitrosomonadales bacterium]
MSNLTFANKPIETTYLAGGCYWGLEDLIRKIPGVVNTEVGFSGGHIKNVSYKEVTRGDTGHAETIKIQFDTNKLSFKKLLLNFFKMHNPTTLNQQGNDNGTQYRSAIFYTNQNQKIVSNQVIDLIDKSLVWEKPIVTEISAFTNFYTAEESHQEYLIKNPEGYSCHFIRDFDFTK